MSLLFYFVINVFGFLFWLSLLSLSLRCWIYEITFQRRFIKESVAASSTFRSRMYGLGLTFDSFDSNHAIANFHETKPETKTWFEFWIPLPNVDTKLPRCWHWLKSWGASTFLIHPCSLFEKKLSQKSLKSDWSEREEITTYYQKRTKNQHGKSR